MENIQLTSEPELVFNNLDVAPPLDENKVCYNCSECPTLIEIVSIDESNIEFKCKNNHQIKISIREYLEQMKRYNDKRLNDKNCQEHKEEYSVFCFDCNEHLCNKCLKSGKHSYHYKIILITECMFFEMIHIHTMENSFRRVSQKKNLE